MCEFISNFLKFVIIVVFFRFQWTDCLELITVKDIEKCDQSRIDKLIYLVSYLSPTKEELEEIKGLLNTICAINNISSEKTYNALMAACTNYANLVDLLLRHKNIDVNFKNNYGETALFYALMPLSLTMQKKVVTLKKLLNNGADPNVQNEAGFTPLMAFFNSIHFYHKDDRDDFLEIIRSLLIAGYDPEITRNVNYSSMHKIIDFLEFMPLDVKCLVVRAISEYVLRVKLELDKHKKLPTVLNNIVLRYLFSKDWLI